MRKAFSNFVFACVQNRVVINICFLGNNVALMLSITCHMFSGRGLAFTTG